MYGLPGAGSWPPGVETAFSSRMVSLGKEGVTHALGYFSDSWGYKNFSILFLRDQFCY